MSHFHHQSHFGHDGYNQQSLQPGSYNDDFNQATPNKQPQQDTSWNNEPRPGTIMLTFFELIRPYFNVSHIDLIFIIQEIFLPLKPRTTPLELYIPSTSISTFILLSSINKIITNSISRTNPAEMLAKIATWISLTLLLEVGLLKLLMFLFKIQTNALIIPQNSNSAKTSNEQQQLQDSYNYNRQPEPVALQSDGVPIFALFSISGYKFVPLSAVMLLNIIFTGALSIWLTPFKLYCYAVTSINAYRCFEALNLSTFTGTPTWEMKQQNQSHIYVLVFAASGIQFLVSWFLTFKS